MTEDFDPLDQIVQQSYSEKEGQSRGRVDHSALITQAIEVGLAERRIRRSSRMVWYGAIAGGIAAAAAIALIVLPISKTPREIGSGASLAHGPNSMNSASVPGAVDLPRVAGHARYSFIVPGSAEFQEYTSTLRLLSGTVEVKVDPRPHLPFRVETSHFTVEVTGTVFTVSATETRVTEGSVRVLASTGEVLRDAVRAGEVFSWSLPNSATPNAPGSEATKAGRGSLQESSVPASTKDGSVESNIDSARLAIRRGDAAAALSLLKKAEGLSPSSEQLAAIKLLRADCAQLGQNPVASQLYRDASASNLEKETTEAALYAAAKAAAESGKRADAIRLFESYLERFPRGSLRREAKARLLELRKSSAGN